MNPLELFSDELENLVEKVAPSVVAIEHRRGHGTGLALTNDGYVLTNAHVVKATNTLQVRFSDGTKFTGEVVGSDDTTDLAVVRTGRVNAPVLPLATAQQVKV